MLGSPPRPWGRRVPWSGHPARVRFTPTPVGTALPMVSSIRRPSVHPHARGDGLPPPVPIRADCGSPPRPWGRPIPQRWRRSHLRFTPTPVGTAQDRQGLWLGHAVHPHARGDGFNDLPRSLNKDGSPPRPWGRLLPRRRNKAGGRFTPTPVGTAPPGRCEPADYRFTPTPVGTAAVRGSGPRRPPVHPHARGDGAPFARSTSDRTGSPPRPWGRRTRYPPGDGRLRFTPTPVGTAPWRASASSVCSVHPHARGDG